MLIFDTSILIEIERNNLKIINKIDKLKNAYLTQTSISFISYYEFTLGLNNKNIKNREKSIEFIEKFNVLDITKNTTDFLIKLKKSYELPLADLLIAAQTFENNAILITNDNDFKEINEIKKIILDL